MLCNFVILRHIWWRLLSKLDLPAFIVGCIWLHMAELAVPTIGNTRRTDLNWVEQCPLPCLPCLPNFGFLHHLWPVRWFHAGCRAIFRMSRGTEAWATSENSKMFKVWRCLLRERSFFGGHYCWTTTMAYPVGDFISSRIPWKFEIWSAKCDAWNPKLLVCASWFLSDHQKQFSHSEYMPLQYHENTWGTSRDTSRSKRTSAADSHQDNTRVLVRWHLSWGVSKGQRWSEHQFRTTVGLGGLWIPC